MFDDFYGYGNMGILSSDTNSFLDFSTGKLIVSKNKVENRKYFYNSLFGAVAFPELADDKC